MEAIEGNIVDIVKGEVFPGRIYFDTHIQKIERLSKVLDYFILPGLVDAHVHIESSMLLPSEFARLAVRHGTLAAVSDPHEIANVSGIEGIDFMLENAERIPFRFVFGAPACVPATSFESTGISITADDINELFQNKKVNYLSEMMNFPGVLNGDTEVMAKIAVARKYGKPIDGHAPGLMGDALRKYVHAGSLEDMAIISTDHECTTLEEAEEKIRSGMKILIRNGSAAKDFDALIPLINRYPAGVMFCTDDFHPDDLLRGHINRMLAKGVAEGVDLFSVIRAATLNPVQHYQIDLGMVQPGTSADFIVVDDLQNFTVRKSFLRGDCVYDRAGEKSDLIFWSETNRNLKTSFPGHFGAAKISVSDIAVTATSDTMKVIQAVNGDLLTHQIFCPVNPGTVVESDKETDTLKLIVLNRYRPAKPAVAFIRGFGLKQGALVSTVAHDSHHIIAVGCDDDSIVKAINHIIDLKGGLAVVYNKNLIDLKLDITGLMSSASGEEVAAEYEALNTAARDMGCVLTAPFMTLSFMALLVIPELKLSDRGLFNVTRFERTDLFV